MRTDIAHRAPIEGRRLMASAQHTTSHHHDLRLWYRQPASLTELMSSGKGPQAGSPSIVDADSRIWQETVMPIGNGDLGGAIFGEISRDRIGFNEKTLWRADREARRPMTAATQSNTAETARRCARCSTYSNRDAAKKQRAWRRTLS